jgi:hypothetical protein
MSRLRQSLWALPALQALLGEALDDVLPKYGKHPFGER